MPFKKVMKDFTSLNVDDYLLIAYCLPRSNISLGQKPKLSGKILHFPLSGTGTHSLNFDARTSSVIGFY